jgi:ribonuclease P/MRP protein subunit RPP40
MYLQVRLTQKSKKINDMIDRGYPFDIIFLDFAKAFDKVPKERLLEKVRAHGVRGVLLAWVRSWLTNRKQRVVLNGECCSSEEVLSGVPQGSVLGPPLFTVFINDLDQAVKFIELLKKFPDDTKLGQTATQEGRACLQRALDLLCEWADQWGMEFNVKKCKVMHLGHSNMAQEYYMNGHKLEVTGHRRGEGHRGNHVQESQACQPVQEGGKDGPDVPVLSQISRAFHYRDRHVFIRLYVQYVRPHLEFAVPAWCPRLVADKEVREKVQRRDIPMVSGLKAHTYQDRIKELGLTTLEERRHQVDMAQTYKIVKEKDMVNKETWFRSVTETGRATRSAADPLNLRPQPFQAGD